ncbi:MAG: cytochrome peroxidase [Xanthobacteraceae bacterium]|nr:cytochrome peroxidase [Xanthobacteraceae bacterium]
MRVRSPVMLALMALATIGPALAQAPADDELLKGAQETFAALPTTAPAVKDNVLSRSRVELGKMLFFEPRLSSSHFLSCNSCHNVGTGGADNLETSIGHGWQRGPRNAPTVLNSVYNTAQFWDGRAEDLKAQAKGPVQAGVEMASTPANVVTTLKSLPDYQKRFADAFPGENDATTFDNMAKAIEAFEATLVTPSRFDAYLEGNKAALTPEERKGLALFISTGCAACHNGVNVGGNGYYPFGVVEKPGAEVLPAGDKGRFAVTKTASDDYVFRAAPLRNIALTAPYFHSGKVWSLEQAVEIMGTSQLGTELKPDEVTAIVAFLGSLTGEQPRIEYPILPPSTEATPKPQLMVTPAK